MGPKHRTSHPRESLRLLKQSERDNLIVQVMTFEAGSFPKAGCQTLYAYGLVPQLRAVQPDIPAGSVLLDPERSRDSIREMAQQL
ncbi:hypothetical protein Slala02_50710 [Streptomyces lavendulae subsp. lavendulae]|nr:hypothetical protein Slala01_24710 [Streptomyces lavendulae subsp. lavendulae]GLX29251.1 hypothetical protein Slala02_50710 [Streptomyces lavendulae subsp. lavendulae]